MNLLPPIKRIFENKSCYIIGGGPSLRDYDFSWLANKNTICVNASFLHVPNPSVIYWSDSYFYDRFANRLINYSCYKVTNKPKKLYDNVYVYRNTGIIGLETDPTGLKSGNNSGYAAINLAFHLGAKTIYLLGYDMDNMGHYRHFHKEYIYSNHVDHNLYKDRMIPHFSSLVEPLKERGVEVINANMNSKLECFTKIPLHRLK